MQYRSPGERLLASSRGSGARHELFAFAALPFGSAGDCCSTGSAGRVIRREATMKSPLSVQRQMKYRLLPALTALPFAAVLLLPATASVATAATLEEELNDIQERLLSGFASHELSSNGRGEPGAKPTDYFPRGSDGCPTNLSSNIKVNQNCLNLSDPDLQGRGQAEHSPSIATDPMNSNHVLASYNDYRRGDAECYASWSVDGARTFNDATIPTSFTRG